MAKIMRTIADARNEIRRESLSTKPLLADDYTYGNEDEQKHIVEEESSENIISDETEIRSNKIKNQK